MGHSKQNPSLATSINDNSPDPEAVFNKILDSVCEVYFSLHGGKNSQKLLEIIRHLRQLKESLNLSN